MSHLGLLTGAGPWRLPRRFYPEAGNADTLTGAGRPSDPAHADVGDEARLGDVMKLTGNFYIGAAIELIAEGMTMGERAGLSRETLLQFYSYMTPGNERLM